MATGLLADLLKQPPIHEATLRVREAGHGKDPHDDFDAARDAAAGAPRDVSRKDAATFDVRCKMREDILYRAPKPDQKPRFGERRQRYGTSVGPQQKALSHPVSEGLARTEVRRGGRGRRNFAAKRSRRGRSASNRCRTAKPIRLSWGRWADPPRNEHCQE